MQEQQDMEIPALASRPILTARQLWLVGEFGRLSRDRRYTEGGPLPLHTGAIKCYFDAFELHDFGFDWFYEWMTKLDGIWLDEVAKKRKKTAEPPKSPAKARPKK